MRSYPLLKIPSIAEPAHVSDVLYVLHFILVTKPIISSWIVRFQVEHTNNVVAIVVFIFIVNISVEQTKFQYNGGSISNRNLTITLSVDIYDSGQGKVTQALTYTSSDIHGIRKSICTLIHVFRKIYLKFSVENWMLQLCLRRNSKDFTAFYDIIIVS